MNIVVCSATEMETALLGQHASVPILVTGIGAVNTAIALTRYLEHHSADGIVICGIGGAYPGSGLEIGDVVCAETECYADLGADSPEGFLGLRELGFPLIAAPAPVWDEWPLSLFPTGRRAKFATVNTGTGRDETAQAIVRRTGAAVENMEGAAACHTARLYGIPVGEIRGISNRAGLRDRASWRIKEAAEAAQLALADWLSHR
jgi:futalosine hydrolase